MHARLPVPAEWRLASLGEKGAKWPWGEKSDNPPANLRGSGAKSTAPVGKYSNGKSAAGCFDMVGNVSEWCAVGSEDFACGGSWLSFLEDIEADATRSIKPTTRLNQLGFRVVREN